MGESSIRQYLAGGVPGIDKAMAIADGAGVSLEWLIRGTGPVRSGDQAHSVAVLDEEAIRTIVVTLQDWLIANGLDVDGTNFWRICRLFYDAADRTARDEAANKAIDISAAREMLEMVGRRR